MRIDLTDVAVERGDAGHADRDVGLPLAPRSTERVADDDGDIDPELCESLPGTPVPTRPESFGSTSTRSCAPLDDWSTPEFAQQKPWWVSVISTGPI